MNQKPQIRGFSSACSPPILNPRSRADRAAPAAPDSPPTIKTGPQIGHDVESNALFRATDVVQPKAEDMTTKFQNHLAIAPAALEVKADSQGRIEGYASTFGGDPDRHNEIVMPGAFAKTVERSRAGDLPVMLWSHAQESPIGRWATIREDSKGLHVEGQLNLNTDRGREAYEHVKAGDAGGLSIGFTVKDGGREYAGDGVWHLKELDVLEISVVAIPANPSARIANVKSLESKAEAVDLLRAAGLSRKAASRFAAGGWPALAGDDHHEKAAHVVRQIDNAIRTMRNKS